jgi:hypothetical protein
MPSVQLASTVSAVAWESIGSGSAGSPYTLMGWVRIVDGKGRPNNPMLTLFRISGSATEIEGSIGYDTRALAQDTVGRDNIILSVVAWSDAVASRVQYPDITGWKYVVLQLGSGSSTNTNMKVFDDASLQKGIPDLNVFYGNTINTPRYVGVSGGGGGMPAQFKYIRAFVSGTFTDAECIAQARSRTPVAHSTAVLWDAWPFDTLQFTGSVNNKVLNVSGTPTLAPDQPFVFINPTVLVTGSNSSVVQISTAGYAPVIIGGR